jgi:hypothetical protein
MIWSFDWGNAWIRLPFALTERSTHVFRSRVARWNYPDISEYAKEPELTWGGRRGEVF